MNKSKLFLTGMLLLSWLTIPFLGKKDLKRYLPSALLICIFTKFLDDFGVRKKWWRFYKGIPPLDSMDFFNWGPYLVSSLWILKMTYKRFFIYLLANTALHIVFIYLGLKYIKRFKILSLVNLTKLHYLLIDFIRALLLYGFQKLVDYFQNNGVKKSPSQS